MCDNRGDGERERERGREKRLYIFNRIRNISSDCFEQRFS